MRGRGRGRVFRFKEKTRNHLQGPGNPGVHGGVVGSGSGGFQTYQVMVPPLPCLIPTESLAPGESTTAVMGINFCDSTQAANFQLWCVSNSWWAGGRVGWGGEGAEWQGHMSCWVWKPSQALRSSLLLSRCLQAKWEVRGKMLASFPIPLSPPTLPSTQTRQFYVSIQPPVGELMAPVFMSENEFKKEQGECSLGLTGRGLSTVHWGSVNSRCRHAAGTSPHSDRGRPRACACSRSFTEGGALQ